MGELEKLKFDPFGEDLSEEEEEEEEGAAVKGEGGGGKLLGLDFAAELRWRCLCLLRDFLFWNQ